MKKKKQTLLANVFFSAVFAKDQAVALVLDAQAVGLFCPHKEILRHA